jgi:hypothetical protein
MRHLAQGGLNMSVRGGLATGAVVVGLLVVGGALLQSPSDDVARIKGADRMNQGKAVLTVHFTPPPDQGGPLAVAVTWQSTLSFFGPATDEGNAVVTTSPYTRTIVVVRGSRVSAAAVPAKRAGGRYGRDWTTECWLHQNGVLMAGTPHDGPNRGAQGCKVSGVAT